MKANNRITKTVSGLLLGIVFLSTAGHANAQLTVSFGSALVQTPDREVGFDAVSTMPFFSNTQLSNYAEDGIRLTFDTAFPNTYATALGPGTFSYQGFLNRNSGFSGNFAYFLNDSRTRYKPLFIKSDDSTPFAALQLAMDTGYTGSMYAHWQAFLQGTEIANGSFGVNNPGTVVGFSGALFDELRIGTYYTPFSTFDFQGSNGNAIVIDNIRADMATAPVPEPETYAMLLAGLGLLGVIARRRRTSMTEWR